ncbi:MAG: toprim domain-containing protein [Mycoplasma sp.]
MNKNNYNADSIRTMGDLEHIREKAGVYLPNELERRLPHLLWEVLDNSIDEMTANYASKIKLTLYKDGSASVEDNGRGIPYEKIIPVFTKTNTSGKFDTGAYSVSVGTNGIGLKAMTAFSKKVQIIVSQNGKKYEAILVDAGKIQKDVTEIGTSKTNGTFVRFWPDKEIFEDLDFNYQVIESRLHKLQFLIKNFNVELIDERSNQKQIFPYEKNLSLTDFLKTLTKDKVIYNETPFSLSGKMEGIEFDLIFQWTDNREFVFESFVNYVNTKEGGVHVKAISENIAPLISSFARENKLLKDRDLNFTNKNAIEGLVLIVSCKVSQDYLAFSSQTKDKLDMKEKSKPGMIIKFIKSVLEDEFPIYSKKNKKEIVSVVSKIINNRNAEEAAKRASEEVKKIKKTPQQEKLLSGKLVKCTSTKTEECELFLCEGDSAAGGLKRGRNKHTQAVLPLRGKPLNPQTVQLSRVLENTELATIIHSMNAGVGKNFDLSKTRYGKIIITADADEDGNHIACILLGFFWKYMKSLVQEGRVFISLTPLFKLTNKKTKEYEYAFTNDELKTLQQSSKFKNKDTDLQRYKGLGELNDLQLVETALDPSTRRLLQLKVEDIEKVDWLFEMTLGNDAKVRKEWINENIKFEIDLE